MKSNYLLIFAIISLLFLSCKEEKASITPPETAGFKKTIQLASAFELYDQGISKQIIDKLSAYIELENFYTNTNLKEYWAEDNFAYLKFPGYHLNFHFKALNKDITLFLKGIRKISDTKYKVHLSIIHKREGKLLASFHLFAIHNNNTITFLDPLAANLQAASKEGTLLEDRITLLNATTEQKPIDNKQADSIKTFIHKMDKFFEKKPAFTIVALDDNEAIESFQGFDYNFYMLHLETKSSGLSDTYNKILFSGNNQFYHPHEIVHFYSHSRHTHQYFDEGIATYFGGSMGFDINGLIQDLNQRIKNKEITLPPDILDLQSISVNNSPPYSIGGLFIKLAMEEYGGRPAVLKLLNAGSTDEDFYRVIEEVFYVKKQDLSNFILQKLEQ